MISNTNIFAMSKVWPVSPRAVLSLVKFYHIKFLSCVKDCIEDMVTLTALAKISTSNFFCNTKVVELGEIFIQRKFSHTRYHHA